MKLFTRKIIKESTAPRGFIDEMNAKSGAIHGWASSKSNQKLTCRIYVNNQLIKSMVPSKFRSDLKDAGVGDGEFGFEVSLPIEFSSDKEVTVRLTSYEKGKEYTIDEKNFMLDSKLEYELPIGNIDRFSGNKVFGWLGAKDYDVYPYITANGTPCEIESSEIKRDDVNLKHGLQKNTGFVAKLPECEYGPIEFKLFAISFNKIELIAEKTIKGGSLVPDSINTIFNTLEIAKKKDSIGIVVWEGTHNPIGRAQVLFNILKTKRPAVIIAFDIGFSTTPVWQPLLNSDCKVLVIPWKDREKYQRLFEEIGLNFDLVWICKPRYPAITLAGYVSHKDTRYVIDLDDNETEMSSSSGAKEKPYGLLSSKMAENFIHKIPSRSVASISLQNDFGGEILRHARHENIIKRSRITDLTQEVRVGFIGTVRPHKGIIEAASAIHTLNKRKGYRIKFVVGGIYDPVSLRSELISYGCEIHGEIDSSRLSYHLQNLDVVITGFPDPEANKEILRYQISSKIGDGLSNGRPVLVPEGDSVKDLSDLPGVHLFNSINFERILERAIKSSDDIRLDEQFSIDFNYRQFLKLEQSALNYSPTADQLFYKEQGVQQDKYSTNKNIILVWKQHDTGLYGRRIDHIARSLSANGLKVTCLEIMSREQLTRYKSQADRIDSDCRYIVEDFEKKKNGYSDSGIKYKTIFDDGIENSETALKEYLLRNKLFPINSKVILFPAVPDWKVVIKVFEGYTKICDVVDNQLGWEKKRPLELLNQYKTIMDLSEVVIFNSYENKKFFKNLGFLNGRESKVIPNWYCLPEGFLISRQSPEAIRPELYRSTFNIVYSGNMNDRFDWDLISRISKEINHPVQIHLIGNCQRALKKMEIICEDPSITYHGPMREKALLKFLSRCDLAIMPHLEDEHSGYMNPMKVMMYERLGLKCVASNVPGIDTDSDNIYVCNTSDDFLSVITDYIESTPSSGVCISNQESGDASCYVENIIKPWV